MALLKYARALLSAASEEIDGRNKEYECKFVNDDARDYACRESVFSWRIWLRRSCDYVRRSEQVDLQEDGVTNDETGDDVVVAGIGPVKVVERAELSITTYTLSA